MAHPEVTMSSQTVHNPDEPRHFMRIKPVGRRVEIRRGDERLAASDRAVWVLEVGRDVYDPVVYLPREDVEVPLHPVDRRTHCPLKGDASYYRTDGRPDDDPDVWAYEAPFDWAPELAAHVAFDGRDVEIRQLAP